MSRNIINAIFACLLISLPALVLVPSGRAGLESSDFPAYYVAAKALTSGNGPLFFDVEYQKAEEHRYLPEAPFHFVSDLPQFLIGVIPFAALDYDTAQNLCRVLIVALLAGALVMMANILEYSNRQTLLLFAFAAMCGPFFETVRVSKPFGALFLLAICLSILFLKKGADAKAGALAALCLVKPQMILPFLAFSTGALRWRFLLGFVVTSVILVLISFPIYGVAGYAKFLSLLSFINSNPELVGSSSMPTIRGQLLRLSVDASTCQTVSAVCFTLACAALFALGVAQRRSPHWWCRGVVMALALGIAASPYMHLYDVIAEMLPCCLLLRWSFSKNTANNHSIGRKLGAAIFICSIITFTLPAYVLVHYTYLLGSHAIVNIHFISLWCLFLLVAYSGVSCAQSPRTKESEPGLDSQ